MDTYNFSLVITPPIVDEETAADSLYGGGCDDALFSVSGGVYEVEFDREAPSFQEAVLSAINDVNKAGIGARVTRVIPDDLVNANAIAERSGKTRQAVRFWHLGERGEGFPAPKAIVGKSPVWSWVSVARWLHGRGEIEADAVKTAQVIAKFNREIEATTEQSPSQPDVMTVGV
ncbi:MAG: DNA-binding protein [Deltaproteobacteria bacterium]|nr:DNA-binding protein [Deltaproteobacteria bacterium]